MAIKRDGHFVTIQEHLVDQQREHPTASGDFSWLLSAITLATKIIASYVRRAGLFDVWGEAGTGENIQGETVQRLDVIANETLKRCLGYRGNVGIIASEEDNDPRIIQDVGTGGKYIVMFDPLDGSSNIDTNVSIGTIFTIFGNPPQALDTAEAVLQPGIRQLAAGYVVYGSSTTLVYTAGRGVHMFTLDPQFGSYLLTRENIMMPAHTPEYSLNEAYRAQFPQPYQDYLFWCKGERPDGPTAPPKKGFSLRYIGSLVADFHRILVKGGVFLYPPTIKQPEGKLRLMYEANPLAFIAEQAGGLASDGTNPILRKRPVSVHDRTPLVIGSKQNVEEVLAFVNAAKGKEARALAK